MTDGKCSGCPGCGGSCPSAEDLAKEQAEALVILKEIVEKHGGTVVEDPDTGVFMVNVPEENKFAAALEIEEKMGLENIL